MQRDYVVSSRNEPARLLENAQTVMVLGSAYSPMHQKVLPRAAQKQPTGRIASYACYEDYHHVIKQRCQSLLVNIETFIGKSLNHRIFVDSGPVMEKDFAWMAGLGWIGRNSLFIHPRFGSYCLLACVFLDYPLKSGNPFSKDLCGNCRACLDACPTGCIHPGRTIDARACLSYLTIEHRDIIPRDFRKKMNNWIFGCDICQMVCPLNREVLSNSAGQGNKMAHKISASPDLELELKSTEQDFSVRHQSTPVLRATHSGWLRNAIIAAGNAGSHSLLKELIFLLTHHSSPVIRLHAAWAVGRYASATAKHALQKALQAEQDKDVKWEILQSLRDTLL